MSVPWPEFTSLSASDHYRHYKCVCVFFPHFRWMRISSSSSSSSGISKCTTVHKFADQMIDQQSKKMLLLFYLFASTGNDDHTCAAHPSAAAAAIVDSTSIAIEKHFHPLSLFLINVPALSSPVTVCVHVNERGQIYSVAAAVTATTMEAAINEKQTCAQASRHTQIKLNQRRI